MPLLRCTGSIFNHGKYYESQFYFSPVSNLPRKNLVPNRSVKAGAGSFMELEKRAAAAEATLAEVKKEFDTYRTEKCENERLISQELSESREALTEARTKAVKLAAQEEHNTERFKIANANAQAFRKQVKYSIAPAFFPVLRGKKQVFRLT